MSKYLPAVPRAPIAAVATSIFRRASHRDEGASGEPIASIEQLQRLRDALDLEIAERRAAERTVSPTGGRR